MSLIPPFAPRRDERIWSHGKTTTLPICAFDSRKRRASLIWSKENMQVMIGLPQVGRKIVIV
jgi:hypothetical protein